MPSQPRREGLVTLPQPPPRPTRLAPRRDASLGLPRPRPPASGPFPGLEPLSPRCTWRAGPFLRTSVVPACAATSAA
eukprot:2092029-Pyramimonas_sp.AAC.1